MDEIKRTGQIEGAEGPRKLGRQTSTGDESSQNWSQRFLSTFNSTPTHIVFKINPQNSAQKLK